MYQKKLIETSFPIQKVNAETEREKSARNGLPSSVHIWWNRRSMAAARSVIFTSLVDDPDEHPELFPNEECRNTERKRLLKMAEELSEIESANKPEVLQEAISEIEKYSKGTMPTVFDPFVGSGAIPVEAHRLGLKTEASDLNSVAGMITTVVASIPTRFQNQFPIHPATSLILGDCMSGAKALADDVKYYGEWMLEEAERRIGKLYPKVINPETGKELTVSAWIWARTVKCPNPSCNCNIPLSSSYDLAKKKGSEAWVEPVMENGIIKFVMNRSPHAEEKGKPKVAPTAVFKCPVCGEITPDAYVKECGKNHKINSQMIAVVADEGKKRLYLEPDIEQITIADVQAPQHLPHGELPDFPKRFSPPGFGLTDYADLFTNRQLVFITTMFKLTKEVQEQALIQAIESGMADDGIDYCSGGTGALAYAQAVRTCLAVTVSKLLDRCSNLCSWSSSSGGSLRNVFSRAAMPMIWDYAEGNPLADAGGSFANALSRTCESIASLPAGISNRTIVADAAEANDVQKAIISTDLPYYDRSSYSDLSDFFYVWMKYGLEDLFPDFFKEKLTKKKEEMTSFSYRWNGDKKQSDAFYGEGLRLALTNFYKSASDDYPSTVAFIYKPDVVASEDELTEWERFVDAISLAGFMTTASWPVGRNYEESIELAESRGIPITVVLRKRPNEAPSTTRRNFVATVKREIPTIIEGLSHHVDICDLRTSTIGPALNIYTRYKQVLDADGAVMKPCAASRIIEQEINTVITNFYNNVGKDKEEDIIHD